LNGFGPTLGRSFDLAVETMPKEMKSLQILNGRSVLWKKGMQGKGGWRDISEQPKSHRKNGKK